MGEGIRQALVFASTPHREAMLLVNALDAMRLCRKGGYQAIGRQAAQHHWVEVSRDEWQLRAFLVSTRLPSPPLASLNRTRLQEHVRRLLERGAIVLLRQRAVDGERDAATGRQRRLVRSIESAGFRPSFEGRRYKLVAGNDLVKLANRDQHDVVAQAEATKVLGALAREATPPLAKLLVEATELLTPDWRPPFFPTGLVLLKAIVTRDSLPPQRRGHEAAPAARPVRPPEPDLDIDQACQASTLVNAAREGVPFCQEC